MSVAPDPALALTLEQHAGIAVALAEGFPRAEVLSQERIDEKAYRPADAAWKKRLVDDAGGEGKLFAAYQAKRAEAEDWLRRKVDPLDADLSAWLGFLKAWSAAPKPFEILSGHGLTLADVGRLGRAWERAFARDDKLARRAEQLTRSARMPGKVTVEPGKLRPFPWSPGVAETPSAPAAPPDVPSAKAKAGPGAESASGRALPSYARNIAPDSTAPVFYLSGTDGLPFSPDSGSSKIEFAPSKPSTPGMRGETALVLDLSRMPVTPFEPASSKGASAEKTGGPSAENVAAPQKPEEPAFGTVAVFELPKSLILPFAPAAAPSSDPAATPKNREQGAAAGASKKVSPEPSPSRVPETRPPAIGETVTLDPALVQRAALPFSGDARPENETPPVVRQAPPPESPPRLSLLEHAALCAEIDHRPSTAADVLARAGLDPASKAALDTYFEELRAERPAAEAAWTKAYRESYTRLVVSAWKGPARP